MKTFLALVLIALLAPFVVAQTKGTPRFENFPAPVYKGKRAPLKLSSGNARTFRTRLTEGARDGVNFAGHYTLVSWGCGAGCLQVGIIDVRTGTVYFPEQLGGFQVWFWSDDPNEEVLRFKPDSRLLIMSGFPVSRSGEKGGIVYYEWTGTQLKLVKLIEKKREEGR